MIHYMYLALGVTVMSPHILPTSSPHSLDTPHTHTHTLPLPPKELATSQITAFTETHHYNIHITPHVQVVFEQLLNFQKKRLLFWNILVVVYHISLSLPASLPPSLPPSLSSLPPSLPSLPASLPPLSDPRSARLPSREGVPLVRRHASGPPHLRPGTHR